MNPVLLHYCLLLIQCNKTQQHHKIRPQTAESAFLWHNVWQKKLKIIFLMQGWMDLLYVPSEEWECQFAFVLEATILHRNSSNQINLSFPSTFKPLMPLRTLFWLMNVWFFSPLRNPHFPHMWWAFDIYEPRNGWSREARLNGWSVCSVICEESIRSKLRNSRIGGAIKADIRPLNHPTFQPLSYLWESFLAALISPCLPSSVFETLADWKSLSASLLRTTAQAVNKPSSNLSAPKGTS